MEHIHTSCMKYIRTCGDELHVIMKDLHHTDVCILWKIICNCEAEYIHKNDINKSNQLHGALYTSCMQYIRTCGDGLHELWKIFNHTHECILCKIICNCVSEYIYRKDMNKSHQLHGAHIYFIYAIYKNMW